MEKTTQISIYDECIKLHALKWLANYQDLNIIEYIELHGGSILTYYIGELGPNHIINDINKQIEFELN